MEINLLAVGACGIISMVTGFVWYGPLFGKKWLEIIGATAMDMEARKKMQKSAGPLYAVQFLLTLFQAYILAIFIAVVLEFFETNNALTTALHLSLLIWAAFIMPIVAGSAMWNNDSRKIASTRFLLQAGYQLVLFIVFGLILGSWR